MFVFRQIMLLSFNFILYKFNISTVCFIDSLKFVCFYNKRKKKQIKKPGHLGIGPGCLKQSSDKPGSSIKFELRYESQMQIRFNSFCL